MKSRIENLLAAATGIEEGWTEADVLPAVDGAEYWFVHTGEGLDAYVVNRKGSLTVEIRELKKVE